MFKTSSFPITQSWVRHSWKCFENIELLKNATKQMELTWIYFNEATRTQFYKQMLFLKRINRSTSNKLCHNIRWYIQSYSWNQWQIWDYWNLLGCSQCHSSISLSLWPSFAHKELFCLWPTFWQKVGGYLSVLLLKGILLRRLCTLDQQYRSDSCCIVIDLLDINQQKSNNIVQIKWEI